MRWFIVPTVLVLIAVVSLAAGCSKDEAKTTSNTSAGSETQLATQAPAATAAETPSDQREIGNLLLTVNGAQRYSDDLFPAEAGTYYAAVDVSAKNIGDKTYSLNVFNFHLKDSADFANTPATTKGPEPKIGAHDMVAGQTVRGFIVFKLGEGRTAVELQYQSFTGSTGTIPVPAY